MDSECRAYLLDYFLSGTAILAFLALDPKWKCGTSDSGAQDPERSKHPGVFLICVLLCWLSTHMVIIL